MRVPKPFLCRLRRGVARRIVPLLAVALGTSGLLPAAIPPATSHTVTLNADGTFTPQFLRIHEGDSVAWVGSGSGFARTDAIVRIGAPGPSHTRAQICGAEPGGPSVGVWPHLGFDGPKRKGLSGIHALGPQGHGYIEASTSRPAADCNAVLDPADLPGVRYVTVRSETVGRTRRLLCRKYVLDGADWVPAADGAQGGVSQVLQSTWDNPDIDGVVLRVAWKDFQYDDGVSIVTDWTAIDRELREAIQRGKTVSINIHAGEDTPAFLFTDYDRDPDAPGLQQPAESTVAPVRVKDYGSDREPPLACGSELTLGSPADPSYLAKIQGLYDALAAHFKQDARFFQALGYVKVTGLNLTTGEARLPKRCLDPDASGVAGACWCNTQIWANATHGYTPSALHTFYNEVENRILTAFLHEKSLHFMLIQDGFPRVLDAANYFRDKGHKGDDRKAGTADDGPVGAGFPGASAQTEQILDFGRRGRFARRGDPALLADDLATGKLFVSQHSGLQVHPRDAGRASDCDQTGFHAVLVDNDGKSYYALYTAGVPPLGDVGSGCPNRWAAEQGYLGQLIGYQTTHEVDEPDEIDSSLWNMTAGSNASYYEIYEDAAWAAAKRLGTGPTAAVLDTAGFFPRQGASWQKNLHQWGRQLHARRAAIAAASTATYPHLADPFPSSHRYTFTDPLVTGAANDFWYINPGRCAASPSQQPYGRIQVLAR